MILALVFLSWFQRRVFIAISSLLLLTFFFRFSAQIPANHKFLNVWLVLSNLFVAYGFWRLWHTKAKSRTVPGRVIAIVLAGFVVTGGIINLFPFHNDYYAGMSYDNDQLVKWVRMETDPHAVFLTERFVIHPILLAGRRLFYGWPGYADSAGYDTNARGTIYRDLFESRDAWKVFRLLKQNGIAYVAFDNGIRHGEFIKKPNEQLYAKYFEKVFEDKQNKYGSLIIYKVPEKVPSEFSSVHGRIGESMFEGGNGTQPGQFDFPRGLAVDGSGNILVADTRNSRIEKFSPDGAFLRTFGKPGRGEGEFREPNGIAVDQGGNIYVADVLNRRVQKLGSDGTFIAEWKGPADGFAPRDISIGADNAAYVVDEGHKRIVKFDSDGNVLTVWGARGQGDGQFNQPTSVAVDGTNDRVYVADPQNRRIQVFDTNGKFVTTWFVQQWRPIQNAWYMQHLVVDSRAGRLYATSTQTDEVLVFDLKGTRTGALRPKPPDKLEGASALAIANRKLYVLCTFANRVIQINL